MGAGPRVIGYSQRLAGVNTSSFRRKALWQSVDRNYPKYHCPCIKLDDLQRKDVPSDAEGALRKDGGPGYVRGSVRVYPFPPLLLPFPLPPVLPAPLSPTFCTMEMLFSCKTTVKHFQKNSNYFIF